MSKNHLKNIINKNRISQKPEIQVNFKNGVCQLSLSINCTASKSAVFSGTSRFDQSRKRIKADFTDGIGSNNDI